jgi:hypothetical protein
VKARTERSLSAGPATITFNKPKPSAPTTSACKPSSAAATIPDNRVLVAGGTDGKGLLNTAELYWANTNKWTKLPPMPTAREGAAAAGRGLLVYVAGGEGATGVSDAVEVFDGRTNTWSKLPPMPTARCGANAAVLNDRQLVVAGGRVIAADVASDDLPMFERAVGDGLPSKAGVPLRTATVRVSPYSAHRRA